MAVKNNIPFHLSDLSLPVTALLNIQFYLLAHQWFSLTYLFLQLTNLLYIVHQLVHISVKTKGGIMRDPIVASCPVREYNKSSFRRHMGYKCVLPFFLVWSKEKRIRVFVFILIKRWPKKVRRGLMFYDTAVYVPPTSQTLTHKVKHHKEIISLGEWVGSD